MRHIVLPNKRIRYQHPDHGWVSGIITNVTGFDDLGFGGGYGLSGTVTFDLYADATNSEHLGTMGFPTPIFDALVDKEEILLPDHPRFTSVMDPSKSNVPVRRKRDGDAASCLRTLVQVMLLMGVVGGAAYFAQLRLKEYKTHRKAAKASRTNTSPSVELPESDSTDFFTDFSAFERRLRSSMRNGPNGISFTLPGGLAGEEVRWTGTFNGFKESGGLDLSLSLADPFSLYISYRPVDKFLWERCEIGSSVEFVATFSPKFEQYRYTDKDKYGIQTMVAFWLTDAKPVSPPDNEVGGVVSPGDADELPFRTWTDVNGRVVEAKLISVAEDEVILKTKARGTEIKVPLERLSEADQEFLRKSALDVR